MSYGSMLLTYVAIMVPLLIADALWLGLVAKHFYSEALGPLLAQPIKIVPALIFYLGYPIGLMIFAVSPATGIGHSAVLGALFGLFCYGTYDLVNHSTLKGWPLRLTLVDMTWGTAISAFAAAMPWMLLR